MDVLPVQLPWRPGLSPNAWLRWEAVSRWLPTDATDVLEIGCGRGGFAGRLARRYRYVGVEPEPVSFAVARSRLAASGYADVRNGDVSVVREDETFDLVCAFEVVEHVEDDRAALSAWIAHLRPGGLLMVSAPAGPERFAAADEMVGHYRRYEPLQLQSTLRELGLVETDATRFGAPLGYVLEAIRNGIARSRSDRTSSLSKESRSAASGRLLQPSDGPTADLTYCAALPFRKLQLLLPDRGPSLLAVARKGPRP